MRRRKFVRNLIGILPITRSISNGTDHLCLLGFTNRLLETLWHEPVTIFQVDVNSANSLMPLCAFLEHILQRSRATYATLLATFYYLTLLRSSISKQNSTTDRPENCMPVPRALRCQRRMFITALILAWKYTQDRQYSLGVWAKISGLCSQEIKANEAIFLETVDWRLFIPQAAFERWVRATAVLYSATLSDSALQDSTLSCFEEDQGWPYRLSLLEFGRDDLNIQMPEAKLTPV